MEPTLIGALGILVLLVLMFAGVPIAFSMAIVGIGGLAILVGPEAALRGAIIIPFEHLSSFVLAVVPLFILMGFLAAHSGISKKAYDVAYKWLGGLRGGLAVSTVGACALFAAACGATSAATAAMGKICTPEMRSRGYDVGLATACVAAAGTFATMIPPSINMVIYGIITETSIGKLLVAGILPGLVCAADYTIMILFRAWRNPKLAPAIPFRVTWREKFRASKGVLPIAVLFLSVMGSIYTGVATPTEAASVGAVGAILIALSDRTLNWPLMHEALADTLRITSIVFLILAGAFIFARFIVLSRIPILFSEWLLVLPVPRLVILSGLMVMYIILGMFIDPISMMLLTLPVVFPAIVGLGYDPVWFGVIIIHLVEIALITPPVAGTVYVMSGVCPDVPIEKIFVGIMPFLLMDIISLVIFIAFPQIALFLPNMMKF